MPHSLLMNGLMTIFWWNHLLIIAAWLLKNHWVPRLQMKRISLNGNQGLKLWDSHLIHWIYYLHAQRQDPERLNTSEWSEIKDNQTRAAKAARQPSSRVRLPKVSQTILSKTAASVQSFTSAGESWHHSWYAFGSNLVRSDFKFWKAGPSSYSHFLCKSRSWCAYLHGR